MFLRSGLCQGDFLAKTLERRPASRLSRFLEEGWVWAEHTRTFPLCSVNFYLIL